jgi:RNA polymerase sigma-70 factor (ECF subfamily)
MSSEATVFFPAALVSITKAQASARPETNVPAPLLNKSEPHTKAREHSAETVLEIADVSDSRLLEQAQLGIKEALGALFCRHARAIRNVAFRILRDEAEADDLVQEVFLFIFRGTARFDAQQGSGRSWIIQMAYHRAFERRRYLNSRHFYTNQELEDKGLHLIDPRGHIEFHERSMEGILGKELTARFNAKLSPEQRETIHLYFFEGYTLREIAELTGQTLAKVRHHYYRGLERLRKYVLPKTLLSK